MKRITAILTFLLSASVCFASGWHDYTLDIGDGYNVFRANSMDVCIGKANGRLILYPNDHDNVGPVVRYIVTPDYVLTKNLGRKPRNLFEGDTFQNVDSSQEHFFVIAKVNDEVSGPYSEEEFLQRPEVASLGQLDWQIPTNPNRLTPLLGNIMFIAFSIPFLAIGYFWITIPLIIGTVLLIRYIKTIRRRKAQPESGHVRK